MIRALCLAAVLLMSALPASANARLTVLLDLLRISEVVEILRMEGFASAEELDDDFLTGQGGAFWNAQIGQIYNTDHIYEQLRSALHTELSDKQIDAAIEFFAAEEGRLIITLENAARRALLDEDVERAARDLYLSGSVDEELLQQVSEFVDVNDLLERNISGAMSANVQFYKGLADGRYTEQSEDEILGEVTSQYEDIKADTEEWLYAFLLMAYQPLPPDVLGDYVAYSASPDGRALNAALFLGFEEVYRDISYALGRAVALNAKGDEI